MKRIFLFIATNLAVILTLGIIINIFGLNNYLTANGINYQSLLVFALVLGFGGAFISLAISKMVAKWSMKLQVIDGSENAQAAWIYQTVAHQAQLVGIKMPEVAVYDSPELNAFATGPSRNNSLVAVSTGLIGSMKREEVEAVLGHEVAHIANGDMVTMTLLQGVMNTFVIFLSRVVGFFIDRFLNSDEEGHTPGIGYYVTAFVLDIIFGILASTIVAWYSRRREFRADEGGAQLAGSHNMIGALRRLGAQGDTPELAGGLKGFGIAGKQSKLMSLFSSHPPIEDRIKALSK